MVVTVSAAGIGAAAFLSHVVHRRLADAISAADRDDPNWRLNDLMEHRIPVPDAENSGLIIAEALSSVPENWPSAPPSQPGQSHGPPAGPTEAFGQLGTTATNVRLTDAVTRAIRDELEKHGEAVELIRTVADYSRGRHELQPGPTLIDTPLPETQAVDRRHG